MFVLLNEVMQRKKHALKTADSLVQWNIPGAYLEVFGPLLEVLLCYCPQRGVLSEGTADSHPGRLLPRTLTTCQDGELVGR